jgi:hypothetical protein
VEGSCEYVEKQKRTADKWWSSILTLGSCEYGNESLESTEDGEFFDQLSNY